MNNLASRLLCLAERQRFCRAVCDPSLPRTPALQRRAAIFPQRSGLLESTTMQCPCCARKDRRDDRAELQCRCLYAGIAKDLRSVCWMWPVFTGTLSRTARGLPPALKMAKKLRERHGIQYAVRRYAAFAGHFDTPMHVVELPDGVGVGIDAEDAAVIESLLMPAPVEIEPPRMRIDFNGNAVLGAGFQNLDRCRSHIQGGAGAAARSCGRESSCRDS